MPHGRHYTTSLSHYSQLTRFFGLKKRHLPIMGHLGFPKKLDIATCFKTSNNVQSITSCTPIAALEGGPKSVCQPWATTNLHFDLVRGRKMVGFESQIFLRDI